jgi:flagellin FlaB
MDTMNNKGNLGLISGILLIVFILIGATAASVIMNKKGDVSEEDYTKMVNEVVDDLCNYIKINDVIGKYDGVHAECHIQKIAIMIRPLISTQIDTSAMTIKISDGEHLCILFPTGQVALIGTSSLFDNPLWENTPQGTFSFISIVDDDSSLIDHHVINKNTDTQFIIINLPSDLIMHYGDTMDLTLIPAPGTQRTLSLEAPLPITHVVSLY